MSGHAVPVQQAVRSAHNLRMAVVSGFRIQDRLPQQIRRKDGLCHGLVRVADPDAESVFPAVLNGLSRVNLASGSDLADRIRHAQQQARLEEVRQEFVIQRNRQLMIVQHANARQVRQFAPQVLPAAHDVLGAVNLSADLLDLAAHHQQDGEGVVPGRDRGSVAVAQILVQSQVIGLVSQVIFHDQHVFHHGFIDQINALVLVPVHQVVSVDQGSYVDIRRIVAEHLRKEVALGNRRMAYNQLIRVLNFLCILCVLCRVFRGPGRFLGQSRRDHGPHQHERQQKGQVLFDHCFHGYAVSFLSRSPVRLFPGISRAVPSALCASGPARCSSGKIRLRVCWH